MVLPIQIITDFYRPSWPCKKKSESLCSRERRRRVSRAWSFLPSPRPLPDPRSLTRRSLARSLSLLLKVGLGGRGRAAAVLLRLPPSLPPLPSTTNANRLGRRSGRKRLGETGTSNFRGKGSSVKQLRICLKETIDAPYSWSYSGKDFKRRGFALESSLYGTAEEKGKGGKRVLAAVAL